eukprot:gene8812-636_t
MRARARAARRNGVRRGSAPRAREAKPDACPTRRNDAQSGIRVSGT